MDDTKLMRALRGQATDGVPFWEVWFAMEGLATHVVGEPVTDLASKVCFAADS